MFVNCGDYFTFTVAAVSILFSVFVGVVVAYLWLLLHIDVGTAAIKSR